jgi:hypothetical protein
MHTYILIRGIQKDAERWIEDMSYKFLPFIYDGKQTMMQLSMRPIWLYECVYPEAVHDAFIQTIQPNTKEVDGGYYQNYDKIFWTLRKMIGLNKTEINPSAVYKIDQSQSFSRVNLGVHLIGSKPDEKEEIKIINEKL